MADDIIVDDDLCSSDAVIALLRLPREDYKARTLLTKSVLILVH